MIDIQLTIAVVALLATLIALRTYHTSKLPPGPPGWPIFGHALSIPKKRPWLAFERWGAKCGPLISLRVFSRKLIVINSYQLALQLFDRRSAMYADKPRRSMLELSGLGRTIIFSPYNDRVRSARKLLQSGLNSTIIAQYRPLQQREALKLARRLVDDPTQFMRHNYHAITTVLMMMTYGHNPKDDNDRVARLAAEVMRSVGDVVVPGRYLVDALPFLRLLPDWSPGASFKRIARRYKETLEEYMELPIQQVKKQMQQGIALPSFVQRHMEGRLESISEQDYDVLKWTAGNLHGAGSDTTAGVLNSLILAMVVHPDIQEKVRRELDDVVGRNAFPQFEHRPHLPYLECIIKEGYRWHPPTPLISHSAREDDIVDGYHIPAGTPIIANIWTFTHDPSLYPKPHEFNPDRYLSHPPPPDPKDFVFGFGRRACPGDKIADEMVFIMLATILSIFRISPVVDKNGHYILPKLAFTGDATNRPLPFECVIEPRSEALVRLVKSATED